MATANASKSRIYVSSSIESTAGTAATLNKSFYPKAFNLKLLTDEAPDDVVTGYLNATTITREAYRADGELVGYLQPDLAAWTLKMLFGQAPSSALVSPSTTVYEHTYQSFAATVATFTVMKQLAAISTYTERFAGNAVKTWKLTSGKGKVELSAGLVGMGVHNRGASEPSSTPGTETFLLGVNTDLKVDGTAVTKGTLLSSWSATIESGIDIIDAAGSTDGTQTRIDWTGLRKVSAEFTLLEENRNKLDDYVAETFRSWEFICTGPTIDTPNSLTSLVAIKLEKGRITKVWPSEVGPHGVHSVKIAVEGIIDTATGRDLTVRVRNLTASY